MKVLEINTKTKANTQKRNNHALLDRIPITAVQKQVGHKRLATTQIYSNLAPEQAREAYEKK